MAYSKAHQFDTLTYSQSTWSKALSHPARIIILKHLLDHGVTPFYVLANKIPLAKPTVSQHICMLRQAGLIESFERYPNTFYQLKKSTCKKFADKINSLNDSFSNE